MLPHRTRPFDGLGGRDLSGARGSRPVSGYTDAGLDGLTPVQRIKLRRQVDQILTAVAPKGVDETEGLARAILHSPQMAPYLLAWRYLLAAEIRKESAPTALSH